VIPFPHILLASKSPRRQFLLKDAGFEYTFVDIEADETYPEELQREAVCMWLAEHKASHFTGELGEKVLVTADTIVCIDGMILNKPADEAEAIQMLQQLSGNKHEVFTGVCIMNSGKKQVFFDRTEVFFHTLTEEEIKHYVTHFHPFDKAGSYGVQDWMGYLGVEKINGCFYNVMGFPLAKFYRELQDFLR
jgi:septum formation protein